MLQTYSLELGKMKDHDNTVEPGFPWLNLNLEKGVCSVEERTQNLARSNGTRNPRRELNAWECVERERLIQRFMIYAPDSS